LRNKYNIKMLSWVWWYTPIIPSLGGLNRRNKNSRLALARSYLNKTKKENKKTIL
jgi:hypothetical protein